MISSSWLLFFKEADFLRNVFSKNGYRKEFLNSCVRQFLNLKRGRDNPLCLVLALDPGT